MKLEPSQQQAKQQFKKRNPELDSVLRKTKLKIERDNSRVETLEIVESKPHSALIPIKFKSKFLSVFYSTLNGRNSKLTTTFAKNSLKEQ